MYATPPEKVTGNPRKRKRQRLRLVANYYYFLNLEKSKGSIMTQPLNMVAVAKSKI